MTRTPANDAIPAIEIDMTDEEKAMLEAKARALGIDMEGYMRVRLVGGRLPEPVAFVALLRRLQSFGGEFTEHVRAVAERRPDALAETRVLEAVFAQLVEDWDDLYGPR